MFVGHGRHTLSLVLWPCTGRVRACRALHEKHAKVVSCRPFGGQSLPPAADEKPATPPTTKQPLRMLHETKKQLAILTASQFMRDGGLSLLVPMLPLLATELGTSATGIGIIISLPSAARLLLNMPMGRLADTIGRKPLMVWGSWLTALSTVATGHATSLMMMVPVRTITGVGR